MDDLDVMVSVCHSAPLTGLEDIVERAEITWTRHSKRFYRCRSLLDVSNMAMLQVNGVMRCRLTKASNSRLFATHIPLDSILKHCATAR